MWEPLVSMADTLGNPWQMVETSSSLTHFLRKDTGGPLASEAGCIKIGNRWLAECWSACKVEHYVRARELDFLVEDELVGREVTMLHFFKFWAPSKWPPLRTVHYLLWIQRTCWLKQVYVGFSLFESCFKHPHGLWRAIARWNNSEDKGISLKDFCLSQWVGLKLIHVCYVYRFLRVVPPLFPVLNPAISHWRRHQRLKYEPVAPWGR